MIIYVDLALCLDFSIYHLHKTENTPQSNSSPSNSLQRIIYSF